MLQGPDSAQSISAAKHKSAEERHQQLTILRNRHINWKKSKLGDPDANMRTLQEGECEKVSQRQYLCISFLFFSNDVDFSFLLD